LATNAVSYTTARDMIQASLNMLAKVHLTADRLAALLELIVDCQLVPRGVLGETQELNSEA
jgi:hypothetical protein